MGAKASAGTEAGSSPPKAALAVVYATVFLDLLGFGIILPALPFYAETLGASGLGLGILLTSYSLSQLVGAAFLGRISDRLGRRPILLLSLAGASVGMLLTGVAKSLALLAAARALAGLFGGSISTAQAYVADVTRPEERARYMGLVGASVGAGFVFGPGLGAVVLALGGSFAGAAFVAAGLAAANLIFAFFRLDESLQKGAVARPRAGLRRWLASLGRQNLWQILWGTFFVTFAFVGMETTFAFFGKDRFGLDEVGFGMVLVMVGLLVVAVQGGLVGVLARRFGVRRVGILGAALMGLGLLVVPMSSVLGGAVFGVAILAAGQGLAYPSLATLASQVSGAEEQGAILGLRQSLAAGARAVGPVVAGSLYDLHLSAPYLVGGVLALVAASLVAMVRQ